jgi:hypothetical protein
MEHSCAHAHGIALAYAISHDDLSANMHIYMRIGTHMYTLQYVP